MRFSTVALLATGAAAWAVPKNDTGIAYTTEVVTALTTYCPSATEITHNGHTYTVTSATTLTITNCPCTITHSYPISSTPAPPTSTPCTTTEAPVKPTTTPYPTKSAPYTLSNSTVTYSKPAPSGTVSTSALPKFTGAASHLSAAGAGVAAIAGLVAALL